MTILLALIHAFGTNKDFQPTLLYVGTLYVDFFLLVGLLGG